MKVKIIIAALFFLVISHPCRAQKLEKRPAIFGIVKTERLACRREPSINAGVIRNYYGRINFLTAPYSGYFL